MGWKGWIGFAWLGLFIIELWLDLDINTLILASKTKLESGPDSPKFALDIVVRQVTHWDRDFLNIIIDQYNLKSLNYLLWKNTKNKLNINTVIFMCKSRGWWNWFVAREGVIIERPLNDLFHDRRDVILMSRMAVSNVFRTGAVI